MIFKIAEIKHMKLLSGWKLRMAWASNYKDKKNMVPTVQELGGAFFYVGHCHRSTRGEERSGQAGEAVLGEDRVLKVLGLVKRVLKRSTRSSW